MTVIDAFAAASDLELPTVALALDPGAVRAEFKRGLPRLAGEHGIVKVKSISVIRHKPGRRCVIEYDVRVERPDAPRLKARLIGKIRARRYGTEGFRMLEAVWNAGFQEPSPDGISVPEPIGVLPRFNMWLQRKVVGAEATTALLQRDGALLARRIAEAIHKLHTADVPAKRSHLMADELRILHEHLPRVAQGKPELNQRIARLLRACDRLGASLPAAKTRGIHRDFYPEQVLVEKDRLFLLDFDLYCQGDPALDAGNFLGHLREMSLRHPGDSRALLDREHAMEERFVELAGPGTRPAVRAYTTLTLVRHVYLSTQFPERIPFTEVLLELCEERLKNM